MSKLTIISFRPKKEDSKNFQKIKKTLARLGVAESNNADIIRNALKFMADNYENFQEVNKMLRAQGLDI